MDSQSRMMWSTESSFNYLEYSRLSPSASASSSSTVLSPDSPSYHKDDDIQDVLSRPAAPLKAIYVAIVETDEYPQCLMKQDDWDTLTSHFGVGQGFVDACMNDGFASEGKGEGNVRDGKVSFWNVSRVARSDPSTQATSFLQLGVFVTFDLSTSSTTFIAVLKGRDPVVIPCWHIPRPADSPFEILVPTFKSVVQSWALYFRTQDEVLSALEGSTTSHPDNFDVWQILGLGKVYTKCRAELRILERTLEFMMTEHEEYLGFRPASPRVGEKVRSYHCQTERLIDQADCFLERIGALKSIHLNQNTLANCHATKQVAQQTQTLSQASTRDSISMRTMAAIQLCFLPAIFVSAFFSMGFFNSLAGRRAWLFPTVAIPLTVFTIAIWYIWQRNHNTDTTETYSSMVTRPNSPVPAVMKRSNYDTYTRNATPVNNQKTRVANDGTTSTGVKMTDLQPQTHHLGTPPLISTPPGLGTSAAQTYFTGSSSVTLTKVQSPREEKSDISSSGSIVTVRPANLSPAQSARGVQHPPDLPNLEKVLGSASGTPNTPGTIQPPPPGGRSNTSQPYQDRRSAPPQPPPTPATQRVSLDSKRNSGFQQKPRPSIDAALRKSVDQASVSTSVAGSDWFTS
ncbi:MAG: hypothetical protein M1813_001769 [Trichoglossum hirsutum]|nr:MAG: hypothetical protein M1813_001769 [Trichoglossum hirsutum]